MKHWKKSSIAVVFCLAVLLIVASSAMAVSATKWTEPKTQTVPGITERTIIGQLQVAIYKVTGVNHVGFLHFEALFSPDADCDIYLLDSNGNAINESQGYSAGFSGMEFIDIRKTSVVNSEDLDLDGEVDGDTYYVCVVAFNETSPVKIWGYTPRIWEGANDTSTTDQYNYYLQSWPRNADNAKKYKAIASLAGPAYGAPFDFTPRSSGEGAIALTWPVNYADGTPVVGGTLAANMESYLYTGDEWENVGFEHYGNDDNWSGSISDAFGVIEGSTEFGPGKLYSWIPSLYLYMPDGTNFADGVQTITYKGVITYPENLRLFASKTKLKIGSYLTLSGTYALDGAKAPENTSISIYRNGKLYKAAPVKADGTWSLKFRVAAAGTFKFQAKAAGNDTTGLAEETSAVKTVKVVR